MYFPSNAPIGKPIIAPRIESGIEENPPINIAPTTAPAMARRIIHTILIALNIYSNSECLSVVCFFAIFLKINYSTNINI